MAILSTNTDFIVKNGLVVSAGAKIQSTVNSTSTDSGALVVSGGVGIGGDTYVAGIVNFGLSNTVNQTPINILGSGADYNDITVNINTNPNTGDAYVALDTGTLWVWNSSSWVPSTDPSVSVSYANVSTQYYRAPRTFTNVDILYNGVTLANFIAGDFYYDDGTNNPNGDGNPHVYIYYDSGAGYFSFLDLTPPIPR
jgi:hypothetical protein